MSDLGKAYVQILPSAKGISGKIKSTLGSEGSAAGSVFGKSLISKAKGLLAAAGIGKVFKDSIVQGANLEQSLGGIETLFKGSADQVKKFASESYKTVGLSANEYMENVTSFSASLLQSLGGDTEKSAKIANMAMIDMGDNANKMGTNMEDIKNAYQGFAKNNYTMLDNLKIGYGGTKSEMERLLKDATKLTGVKYDISNLSDVYQAIHAIQENLGITGTTAKEAQSTVSGSFNAMKASVTDFLGNMALGQNIGPSLNAVAETTSVFLFDNLLPMIGNFISSLPEALITFIQIAIPKLIEMGANLVRSIAEGLTTGLPSLVEKSQELLNLASEWLSTQFPLLLEKGAEFIRNFFAGFNQALPDALSAISTIVGTILTTIGENGPTILEKGYDLILEMVKGLVKALPDVIRGMGDILSKAIAFILDYLPEFLKKGVEIIGKLAKGIWENLPEILRAIEDVLIQLIRTILDHLPDFLDKGFELLKTVGKGIIEYAPEILSTLVEIIGDLIGKIKENLPEFLDKGIEVVKHLISGIVDTSGELLSSLGDLILSGLDKIGEFFGDFVDSGKEIISNIAGGIGDNVHKVLDHITKLPGEIFDTIDGYYEDFMTAGHNIMIGLANGIGNAIGEVIDSVKSACKNIYDNVTGFFGIHSPSRLFSGVGGYLMQGMAGGIEGNLRPVEKAMSKMEDLTTQDLDKKFVFSSAYKAGQFKDTGAPSSKRAYEETPRPAYIQLVLGGKVYKAFVDDITNEQNKDTELGLAY